MSPRAKNPPPALRRSEPEISARFRAVTRPAAPSGARGSAFRRVPAAAAPSSAARDEGGTRTAQLEQAVRRALRVLSEASAYMPEGVVRRDLVDGTHQVVAELLRAGLGEGA